MRKLTRANTDGLHREHGLAIYRGGMSTGKYGCDPAGVCQSCFREIAATPSVVFCSVSDSADKNRQPESQTSAHRSKGKSEERPRGLVHACELYLRAP